jgi:hypothetical protein
VTGLTLLLFHLANAALLPMLSMRVAAAPASINPGLYAAGTVIISQAVMIPVAIWVANRIDRYGYWRLIMLALLVMPVRAALAASTDAPFMMIPVQILDGLAAGILGVVVPSFIVVLLRGSGHVNAGQSVVMLMQGWGIHESGVNRHDRRSLLICDGIQRPERDCAGGRPALVALCAPDLGNRQYAGWGIAATRRTLTPVR